MEKEFMDLIGYEGSVLDFSNELQARGCEDICDFGNLEEIIESGDIVVAIDESLDRHIQIFFEVTASSDDEGFIDGTNIMITNVENY